MQSGAFQADEHRQKPGGREQAVGLYFGNARISRSGQDGGVWAAISEQDWRDDLLPAGLVDTKVCALDSDWSGLKFVIRKELR